MSVPYTFANTPVGTYLQLINLDANFSYLTNTPTLLGLTVANTLTVNGASIFSGSALFNDISINGAITIHGNTFNPTGVTGTGDIVLNTNPVLVTPNLGVPSFLDLTNATNLPIASIIGIQPSLYPFLATPNSANLRAAVVDETGTGALVFADGPTLTGGTFTSPTINNATLVAPALGTPVSGNLVNCTGYPATAITGIIPIANGGTGLSALGTGVQAALGIAVNTANGFAVLNGSGVLPIAQGGTGAATAPIALNNLLPTQTGNADKFLMTDGAGNPAWNFAVRSVVNIAALRALTVVQNEQISVGGYYTDGDGGGGVFYGATGGAYTDDGGHIIISGGSIGSTATSAWVREIGDVINIKGWGATGNGTTDDTANIQRSLNYAASVTSWSAPTDGTLTAIGVSGYYPNVYFPLGKYKISDVLRIPFVSQITGENSWIIQSDPTKDIFDYLSGASDNQGFLVRFDAFVFVGGRYQLLFHNRNLDNSVFEVSNCDFRLSRSYAIKTYADPSYGGFVWSHLSAHLTVSNCRFINCNQILDNCCDSAVIKDSWLKAYAPYVTPSTAMIRNKGLSATEPTNVLTQLHLQDCSLNPGSTPVAGLRWIDNYGSVFCERCRFGGEGGGMPIVAHLQPPATSFPWVATEVVLNECDLFAGGGGIATTAVVQMYEIPNRIAMQNSIGPANGPYVSNPGGINIATYLSAWESASGRKAYNYFKVTISNMIVDDPFGSVYNAYIPAGLLPYVCGQGTRQTAVEITSPVTINNGLVNNLVSFNSATFDNCGGWSSANPTRLVMPPGCSRANITVNLTLATSGNTKYVGAFLANSGLTGVAGSAGVLTNSAQGDVLSFSAEVSGVSNVSYWVVLIKTDAATTLSLASCTATITGIDYVG
jgi:hypothetical protein